MRHFLNRFQPILSQLQAKTQAIRQAGIQVKGKTCPTNTYKEAMAAELNLLNTQPNLLAYREGQPFTILDQPPSTPGLHVYAVPIGYGSHIHTLSYTQPHHRHTIVLLHGFGVGKAIYHLNLANLLKSLPDHSFYLIDMLGMGLSSRPRFPPRLSNPWMDARQAELFFVEAFEEWRKALGLGQGSKKIKLAGHSMGGYLAGAYALEHPQLFERLVLISPAGIPSRPTATLNRDPRFAPKNARRAALIRALWQRGVTPQGVVRVLGGYGARLVQGYIDQRFPYLDDSHRLLLHDYLYRLAKLRGSGEFGLSRLLEADLYAKLPMAERLSALSMPIGFIYGNHDWMGPQHGIQLVPKLFNGSQVEIVKHAGHQLFLENPREFEDKFVKLIK